MALEQLLTLMVSYIHGDKTNMVNWVKVILEAESYQLKLLN